MVHLGESKRIRPGSACLECGYLLDGASGVGIEGRPKPGDISICIKCGAIAAFDTDMRLRPLTRKEQREVQGDVRMQLARFAISKLHRKH